MIKTKYQLGDLSLVNLDVFPQALHDAYSAPDLVLATDINGDAYTLACESESRTESEGPVMYCLGKAKYVEVKGCATLKHPARQSVQVEPGRYRVKRESEYIHTEHGRHVARYAMLTGKALGFDEQHLKELEFASVIHDIGFVEMEEVLWQTKWFGDEDWMKVQQHPAHGARVVERFIGKWPYATERVRDYVLYHHEHFDGSGYATGLAGEAIPVGSRIILIADAFHAMTSWRPFRDPLPEHVALDRLWGDADYRYDRKLLNVFAEALDAKANSTMFPG